MKVQQMMSPRSYRPIANQFVITDTPDVGVDTQTFQSYDTLIARVTCDHGAESVELDENYYDYSATTGKYRNRFLGEGIADTRKKIKSGEYKLVDLNS